MRHGLSNCLKALGLEDEALEEFSRAINLQKTTGEVWLNVAWNKLERNAFEASRKALLRARELDPSDARVWAFWGIMAEFGAKDQAEALAAYLAALAQEEARARANQSTFLPAAAENQMLSPEDLGLSMLLRMKAARHVFTATPARAAELYLATAGIESRMSEWNLAGGVSSAMLPFPDRDEKTPPAPPPLVSVLKNNRILCGQALLNAGRHAEAAAQFAAAENFAARLPAGGTAYLDFELEPQYYPFRVSSMPIYVKLLNAHVLVRQGKREEARLELQKVRYYLANRSLAQREMQDDPIPALYERIAPTVGLR
jgi:tetratricopeptide (TPR) repeat protein